MRILLATLLLAVTVVGQSRQAISGSGQGRTGMVVAYAGLEHVDENGVGSLRIVMDVDGVGIEAGLHDACPSGGTHFYSSTVKVNGAWYDIYIMLNKHGEHVVSVTRTFRDPGGRFHWDQTQVYQA